MKIYSLENTERLKDNDNLYDMFYPMLKTLNVSVKEYKVKKEREMRMDLICLDIYGDKNLIDELMHINGIIDPYSIKEDDIIYYPDYNNISLYRKNYGGNKIELKKESKQKNEYSQELTTSSPTDSNPISIDKNKNEIIITNKLK